ncbi:MAG: NADH-quinone oxidoreductase subunit J [Chloroflexi bacterium]|nr:NADH-quinone oxidoreductase subunit J [Chloroflexota bacterium]
MSVQDVVFWILAVAVIVPALGVVLVKDLFHSVLLLVVVFIAVAGFFVMMSAEFLGVVQVLIYAGAVSILVIFAIMLTRDVQRGNLPNRIQMPAMVLSALLLATLIWTATQTEWSHIDEGQQDLVDLVQTSSVSLVTDEALLASGFVTDEEQAAARQAGLADLLIGDFVLPFEAVSVLLLASVIGALALVRPR